MEVARGFSHLSRQGKQDLDLIRATPDLMAEQMLVAGCLRKVTYNLDGIGRGRLEALKVPERLAALLHRRSMSRDGGG